MQVPCASIHLPLWAGEIRLPPAWCQQCCCVHSALSVPASLSHSSTAALSRSLPFIQASAQTEQKWLSIRRLHKAFSPTVQHVQCPGTVQNKKWFSGKRAKTKGARRHKKHPQHGHRDGPVASPEAAWPLAMDERGQPACRTGCQRCPTHKQQQVWESWAGIAPVQLGPSTSAPPRPQVPPPPGVHLLPRGMPQESQPLLTVGGAVSEAALSPSGGNGGRDRRGKVNRDGKTSSVSVHTSIHHRTPMGHHSRLFIWAGVHMGGSKTGRGDWQDLDEVTRAAASLHWGGRQSACHTAVGHPASFATSLTAKTTAETTNHTHGCRNPKHHNPDMCKPGGRMHKTPSRHHLLQN